MFSMKKILIVDRTCFIIMKYYNSLKNMEVKNFMKRVIIFLTAFLILMGTVGCSSDETNARISENENKIKEVEKTANSIREELNKSIKTLEEGVKSAKQAQTALEEKVSQFEGLAQRVT